MFHSPHLDIFLCSPAQPPAGAAVQAGEGAEAGEAGGRGGPGGGSGESHLTSNRYCKIFFREIFIGYVRVFEANFCLILKLASHPQELEMKIKQRAFSLQSQSSKV